MKFIKINSTAKDNIFFSMDNVDVSFKSDITSNTFIKLSYANLEFQEQIVGSSVHFSDIQFQILNKKHFYFNKTQIYNSRVYFINNPNSLETLNIVHNSLFYNIYNTSLVSNKLEISNSSLIQASFICDDSSDLFSIVLSNSNFQGNEVRNSLLQFCRKDNVQTSIILKENYFRGYTKPVFDTCSIFSRIPPLFPYKFSEILYDIQWIDNIFDNNQYFFNLDRVKVEVIEDKVLQYIFLDQSISNEKPSLSTPFIKFMDAGESFILQSESVPSQYQLYRNFSFESEDESYFEMINLIPVQVKFGQWVQILSNQTQRINLSNYLQNSKEFFLQISQISSKRSSYPSFKKIFFVSTIFSIQFVTIKPSHIEQSYILRDFNQGSQQQLLLEIEDIIFRFERQKNGFSVEWVSLSAEISTYLISINICEKGYIVDLTDEGKCNPSISQQTKFMHLFYFNNQCDSGYYQDSENSKICNKCKFECQSCSKQLDDCNQCIDKFVRYNNKCIEKCPISTYLEDNQCIPCIENCQKCYDSQFCDKCISFDLNMKCQKCKAKQLNYKGVCINCSQSNCSSCSNLLPQGCIQCEEGFKQVNGICKRHLTHKKCIQGKIEYKDECYSCQIECLTCDSHFQSQKCLICSVSAKIIKRQGICIECKKGFYGINEKCERCDHSCNPNFGCFGPSNRQCIICDSGYKQSKSKQCLSIED